MACRGRTAALPRGVRCRRLAHPATGLVGAAARLETFAIAGPVALEHRVELAPVARPYTVVLRRLVPVQLVVGDRESEEVRLRYGDVDEFLPQLVVAEAFDLPAHRLRGVLRVGVARTE